VVFLEIHDWSTRTIIEKFIVIKKGDHPVIQILENVARELIYCRTRVGESGKARYEMKSRRHLEIIVVQLI